MECIRADVIVSARVAVLRQHSEELESRIKIIWLRHSVTSSKTTSGESAAIFHQCAGLGKHADKRISPLPDCCMLIENLVQQ
jgi:hypothetical protein